MKFRVFIVKNSTNQKIVREICWLAAIIILAALVEYAVIKFLGLHPVVSLRIQGLIGLVVIGYGIRMAARLWAPDDDEPDPSQNGHRHTQPKGR